MSAVVGQDWRKKKLRELFIQYQAVLLETWHHTANLKGCFAADKNTQYTDLHPYLISVAVTKTLRIEPKSLFYESLQSRDFLDEMFGDGPIPSLK